MNMRNAIIGIIDARTIQNIRDLVILNPEPSSHFSLHKWSQQVNPEEQYWYSYPGMSMQHSYGQVLSCGIVVPGPASGQEVRMDSQQIVLPGQLLVP